MKKNKTLYICFLFAFFSGIATAQPDKLKQIKRIEIISMDSAGYESVLIGPDENLNDLFIEQIDSLINSRFLQIYFDISSEQSWDRSVVSLSDSIYLQRLKNIDSYIPLSYNSTVKNLIELYTQRRRDLTEVLLGLSSYYFPLIEEQLDKYNLPMELKYLPIIESALNPNARSRANAVGLWQFMYGTGRQYKLEISTFIDERRDPQKSTEAAITYLNDLYNIYKDWHLAIAAYNCGPGNVNKAIRRTGGSKNYWAIYNYLPRETRGYVPAFIAAAYVMNYYKEHGLSPRLPDFSIVTDTLHISDHLHFNQIAENLRISVEELRAFNPQYRMDIIPGKKDRPLSLVIPIEHIGNFIDNEAIILAHKREEIFPNNQIVIPQGVTTDYHAGDIDGKAKIIYTVKSGDNPGYIATWFHVKTDDLRYWNNIRRNMIRVGQKLTIYVPKQYADFYSKVNQLSFAEKEQYAKRTPVAGKTNDKTLVASNQVSSDGNFVYYTVKSGDTLWSIAQKFPGVTNNDILQLNKMSNSKIQPGQKLKIQAK